MGRSKIVGECLYYDELTGCYEAVPRTEAEYIDRLQRREKAMRIAAAEKVAYRIKGERDRKNKATAILLALVAIFLASLYLLIANG